MDLKETLCRYLQRQREAVLWKVEGLSEREVRMPRTATGTNLLGIVKHLTGVEADYFGACLDRPWPEAVAWDEDAEPNVDMWATATESPTYIVDRYRRATAWADETIAGLPLEAPARVPWWQPQETTLGRLLVHMVAETGRHAGHLDILREEADGARGMLPAVDNLPERDADWWRGYVARLRAVAEGSDTAPP
ncbi:MAG: DinB family protein [Nocardioides sp.]